MSLRMNKRQVDSVTVIDIPEPEEGGRQEAQLQRGESGVEIGVRVQFLACGQAHQK